MNVRVDYDVGEGGVHLAHLKDEAVRRGWCVEVLDWIDCPSLGATGVEIGLFIRAQDQNAA